MLRLFSIRFKSWYFKGKQKNKGVGSAYPFVFLKRYRLSNEQLVIFINFAD